MVPTMITGWVSDRVRSVHDVQVIVFVFVYAYMMVYK